VLHKESNTYACAVLCTCACASVVVEVVVVVVGCVCGGGGGGINYLSVHLAVGPLAVVLVATLKIVHSLFTTGVTA
jgi:hypothetical protein